MAKLRHLGIRTEDTGKLTSFYVDVFDLKVIHKTKEEGGTIFLSDGYFNLAIIPNKDQNATNGLYHFGFEVENGRYASILGENVAGPKVAVDVRHG